MKFRSPLLSVGSTLCATVIASWLLTCYEPLYPAQDAPSVPVSFDGRRAMRHLDALTHKYRGRVAGSAQGFAAADYVANEFRSYGLKVETQDFCEAGGDIRHFSSWGWYKGKNVIGILPGRERGAIVLTAHRDCVAEAPEGAYDNASGTAAVLELARVLAAGEPLRHTHVFVALDGEEIGFAGSRALLNNRPAALEDIRLMVNLDMVGFRSDHELGLAHTQYLPPEARALVAGRFKIPEYMLLQLPMGRGSDALLYTWRGLPALDIHEIMPSSVKVAIHTTGDTRDQVSADSLQETGQAVERLIRQGDVIGAFTPSRGLAPSEGARILPHWRYKLVGACVFFILSVPMVFRLHSIARGCRPAKTMAVLMLIIGILTAVSTMWRGRIYFVVLPVVGTIALLVLQAIAVRTERSADPALGRLLVAAAPPLLFSGTWFLTGLWPLGFWLAIPAYLPAVLVTWRAGWGWRILDIALLLPTLSLMCFITLACWIVAPVHMFPGAKLSVFAGLHAGAALLAIWGIFGRRPSGPGRNLLRGEGGQSARFRMQRPENTSWPIGNIL